MRIFQRILLCAAAAIVVGGALFLNRNALRKLVGSELPTQPPSPVVAYIPPIEPRIEKSPNLKMFHYPETEPRFELPLVPHGSLVSAIDLEEKRFARIQTNAKGQPEAITVWDCVSKQKLDERTLPNNEQVSGLRWSKGNCLVLAQGKTVLVWSRPEAGLRPLIVLPKDVTWMDEIWDADLALCRLEDGSLACIDLQNGALRWHVGARKKRERSLTRHMRNYRCGDGSTFFQITGNGLVLRSMKDGQVMTEVPGSELPLPFQPIGEEMSEGLSAVHKVLGSALLKAAVACYWGRHAWIEDGGKKLMVAVEPDINSAFIKVYDVETGRLEQFVRGTSEECTPLMFPWSYSPWESVPLENGAPGVLSLEKHDATRVSGGAEVIWNIDAHLGDIFSVDVDPQGKWAVSAGDDGQVKLWVGASGKLRWSNRCFAGYVRIDPKGDWVSAFDGNRVIVWKVDDGHELLNVELPSVSSPSEYLKGSSGMVLAGGKIFVSQGGDTIVSVDPNTGQTTQLPLAKGLQVHCMASSPSGDQLAVFAAKPRSYETSGYVPGPLPELWLFNSKTLAPTLHMSTQKPSHWDGGPGHLHGALSFATDGKRIRWVSAWDCGGGDATWECEWDLTHRKVITVPGIRREGPLEGYPAMGDVNFDASRTSSNGRFTLSGGHHVGYC